MKRRLTQALSKRRDTLKKSIAFLPFLFTLGNAFFGFCAIILAAKNNWIAAAQCIFLGALMDMLDGRIARFMGKESDFGMQLDSLSDAISFCLAPAFLTYQWHLKYLGGMGLAACGFFVLAGILRLARFNLLCGRHTNCFVGLPTTIAGCFLVSLMLKGKAWFPLGGFRIALAIVVAMVAVLMISTMPFPAFKRRSRERRMPQTVAFLVFTFAIVAVFRLDSILLFLMSMYFLYAFAGVFFHHFSPK